MQNLALKTTHCIHSSIMIRSKQMNEMTSIEFQYLIKHCDTEWINKFDKKCFFDVLISTVTQVTRIRLDFDLKLKIKKISYEMCWVNNKNHFCSNIEFCFFYYQLNSFCLIDLIVVFLFCGEK